MLFRNLTVYAVNRHGVRKSGAFPKLFYACSAYVVMRAAYTTTIMADTRDDYDPEATVYEAVATLETEHYTREEIHDALVAVADDIQPSDA